MVFNFREGRTSRSSTVNPPTETREYIATGTNDQSYVKLFAYGGTPAILGTTDGLLYRQDIKVEPGGFNRWLVSVPYAARKQQTGEFTFSFDTTGGSFHIKASKETVGRFPNTAPDCKQLIGVNGEEVAGADIVIPALKWNISFRHPLGFVTIPFTKHLARQTGKCNSDTFLYSAAGEVLFLGATGSDGSTAEAEVGYQFAHSENLQNEVVGAITGIQKDGWNVAWIKWKDAVDDGKSVKQPEFVYVERVYDRIAMATALGFGG